MDKAELLARFSEDPDAYYRVALFEDEGFERKQCARCARYFWTQDAGRSLCPDDDAAGAYSFIGSPPSPRRLDYVGAWSEVRSFFEGSGHTPVGRYPVVCRWRDDLYFTIASIVDFQRPTRSGIEFKLPANPLVVPQTCLRFNDLGNVGVTGRHFSSFCMIGQHCIADEAGGYWKDECMRLDYELLTARLGIPGSDVTFVEDVWAGGGSFGSSLEYFVGGLELGNAVFTEFQGEIGAGTRLDRRIIDMGAGLERFAWITSGTPTAYDCCFGPMTAELAGRLGADADSDVLRRYYVAVARALGGMGANEARRAAISAIEGATDEFVRRTVEPLEAAYTVADHLRTLAFAIADGALPSNVGGGYNLRMLLRRMMGALGRLGGAAGLDELIDMHVDYLRRMYPELAEARSEIKEIVGIEARRYDGARSRMEGIAKKVASSRKAPTVDELVTLYESDGIAPDYLLEAGAIREVPAGFYERLSELHQSSPKKAQPAIAGIGELPPTELLFYGEDPTEFDARVVWSSGSMAVLNRTSFYARSGGQEPDSGSIDGAAVTDVTMHGGVVVHELERAAPEAGTAVRCMVDAARRRSITAHHTSTHILNSSSRAVLGSWVWQHSAFKDSSYARLDVTHHSALGDDEVARIEQKANDIVRQNLRVSTSTHARSEAEARFGFRIYQGGVVPVDSVRIVSVGDFDVEACGGTHVSSTGEIGLIKITRTERVQDGVIRLVFAAGEAALRHVQAQERTISRVAGALGADTQKVAESLERSLETAESSRRQLRHLTKRSRSALAAAAAAAAEQAGSVKLYVEADEEMDADYHISIGEEAVGLEPSLVYCALVRSGTRVKIVAYAGSAASESCGAGELVRKVSALLGGSGGGSARFAQGGGADASQMRSAASRVRELVGG